MKWFETRNYEDKNLEAQNSKSRKIKNVNVQWRRYENTNIESRHFLIFCYCLLLLVVVGVVVCISVNFCVNNWLYILINCVDHIFTCILTDKLHTTLKCSVWHFFFIFTFEIKTLIYLAPLKNERVYCFTHVCRSVSTLVGQSVGPLTKPSKDRLFYKKKIEVLLQSGRLWCFAVSVRKLKPWS
jgi:hypothetical protein